MPVRFFDRIREGFDTPDGVIDGDVPTAIDRDAVVPVNPKSINAVYDLSGRKVGTSVEGLPKGLYIVGGKKLLVK